MHLRSGARGAGGRAASVGSKFLVNRHVRVAVLSDEVRADSFTTFLVCSSLTFMAHLRRSRQPDQSWAEIQAGFRPGRLTVGDGVADLNDEDVEVVPGSGEVGRVAFAGRRLPLGYYRIAKTAATFQQVNGRRFSMMVTTRLLRRMAVSRYSVAARAV